MESLPDIFAENRVLGAAATRVRTVGLALGAVGVAASAALVAVTPAGVEQLLFSYLLDYAFLLSLALGALFFVILQHLTRAGWSVVLRRLAESVAMVLPLLAVLAVPVALGVHELYHWSHADAVAADPVLAAKSAYLNVPFFLVRLVVYLVVWVALARFFFSRSVSQDTSGDVALTSAMERRSAPAMLLFAATVTFASVDLLMSLDPHWYSTIFGVYFFAGSVVGSLALLIVLARALQGSGRLARAITVEHYHDLGKLLFAFTVFWAYIAFSQYMLMWYANIPEETVWLLRRQSHGWQWVGLALLLGHFVLPFAVLLSRGPKRRPRLLAAVAGWVLAMHWVDMFWLVAPELHGDAVKVHGLDVTVLLALAGLAVSAWAHVMRRCALVPQRDPRLAESLGFENA
jgi:hypothetical protein